VTFYLLYEKRIEKLTCKRSSVVVAIIKMQYLSFVNQLQQIGYQTSSCCHDLQILHSRLIVALFIDLCLYTTPFTYWLALNRQFDQCRGLF
jgi:hypothetical protein